MKFDEEKAKNLFLEAFGEISPADAVEVHNIWAREEYPDNEIFENGEDFLNEFFRTPYDAVTAAQFGNYRCTDDWVWLNAFANLESDSFTPRVIDEELLADWYIDQHWAELPPAFWEFCEYMDAAGDDEEGDENDDATEK